MPPSSADGAPPPASRGSEDASTRVERSAGGVVVRPTREGHRILVIRDPYQKWGLPKGHLEPGETPAQAAAREVREEAGLGSLELGPGLGEIDWIFRLEGRRIHKFCRFFLMASYEGGVEPELAEGITECVWLAPDEALRRIAYDNAREILKRGLARLVDPARPGQTPWEESE